MLGAVAREVMERGMGDLGIRVGREEGGMGEGWNPGGGGGEEGGGEVVEGDEWGGEGGGGGISHFP